MESKRVKPVFYIKPESLIKYNQKGVYFAKPRLVAFYDYNHGEVTDAKRMKYFRNLASNQYPLDLNVDVDKYIPRKSCMYHGNISFSLKYVMKSGAVVDDMENIDKTKVITRRGTLAKIMESYYNKNFGNFTLYVSRYNCNLYMVLDEEDDSLNELTPAKTHHRRLDQLLFADSPKKPPKIDEPCDDNIMLIGVHRCKFGKYDVIYSGEIQGIDSDEAIDNFDDFDELNQCRYVFTKQMWKTIKNKDNKYLKFWLQSYLANVTDIYIAYKEDGIVNESIEHKLSRELPENRFWKPAMCTGFLYEFLRNIEKEMSSVNDLNTVYAFQYNPNENSFYCEIFKGKNDKTFVTEEYIEYCEII